MGLLDKASTPRGGKVDLRGGFNRTTFLATNQNEIRAAFHFPLTAENPEGLPLIGVIDKIFRCRHLAGNRTDYRPKH